MDDELTPKEKLQIENEIEAMKQELDFGSETFIAEDAPPEIVKMFLENVRNFEEGQSKEGAIITVREHLGEYDFKNHKEIEDEDMELEISHLLELLQEKRIIIDRPDHLTPRGYYHFLVTVFMEKEMNHPLLPGMVHGFIYDEIRHDGPMYIEDHVLESVEDIFDLAAPFQGTWLTEECRSDKTYIPKEKIVAKVSDFRGRYEKIIPVAYGPDGIKQGGPFVYFTFGVHWKGILPDGSKENYEGMGIAQLIFEKGEWMVQGIDMPGFKF
jgi:hypothetical protein